MLAANVSGKLNAGQLDLTGASLNYSQISNPPEIPSDSKINTLIQNYLSEHPITTGDTITIVDYTNNGRQYEGKSTQKDETLPDGIVKRIIMVTHNGTNTTYTEYVADNNKGYLLTNVGKGSDSEGSNGFFKVDTAGLLKARNAIIYGSIFADTGYFGNMYIDGKKIIAGSTDYRNANSYFDDNGILHCKGIRINEGIITWESISNADSMVSGNTSVQQAITNAGAAATNASNALAIAGNAADTASYAEATANTAQTTANTANSNATKAKNAADNAQSTADSAQSTANSANTKATNAQTTANQAANDASTALSRVNEKSDAWVTNITQNEITTGSLVAQNLAVNAANIIGTLSASHIDTEGLILKTLNNENNVGSINISNGVISLLDSSGNIRLNISGDKITGSSQSPISGNISFGVSANNVTIPSGGYTSAVAQTSKVSFTCNKTGSLVINLPSFSVSGSFNNSSGNKSIIITGTILVDDKVIGTIESAKTINIPLNSTSGTASFSATKFYAGVGSGTHTIQIKFEGVFIAGGSSATIGNFNVNNAPKADYTVTFGSQLTQIGSNGFRMMSNGTDMVEFLTNDYNSGIYSIMCGSGGSARGIRVENGTLKLLIGTTAYALSVENGYVKASTTSW